MNPADLFTYLSTKFRQRSKKLYAVLFFLIYILDAWLIGSLAFLFSDWDLMRRCMVNPFLAAVAVPKHALAPWLLLNVLVFGSLALIFFGLWTRYPELAFRLFPKKGPVPSNDPTCGTASWMSRREAERHFRFGWGPGIVLGRFEGEILRHDNPRLNRNCIVFGPPLTGKTWCLNVLQAVFSGESAVITDPKTEILQKTLSLFQKNDYVVRVFDLVNITSSDCWNPISEVHSDLDAYLLSQVVMENTEGPRHRPLRDQFWERSEQNLLTALILYTVYEAKDKNFPGLYDFLTCGSFDELDSAFRSLPDDHSAKRPYNLFCMADSKVRGNIVQGLGTRLKVFQDKTVRELTSCSDIDLALPGRKKCAYFCVFPDTDSTFRFLSALFFSFLFIRLVRQADRFGGRNPVQTAFIMDEFCNIGVLPDFKEKIATMRSREIHCLMVAQSLPQLKDRYPQETWKEIIGCCALRLVWGSAELDTAKYVSELLGASTVEQVSFCRCSDVFDSAQVTKTPRSRPLLDPSEVGRLQPDEALTLVLGANPVRFKKVPYTEHPLAGELVPVRKYVPVRNKSFDRADVRVEYGESHAMEDWSDWTAIQT